MATATSENLYNLSPDQQDLLLAALTSNSTSSPIFNTPSLSMISHQGTQKSPPSQRNSFPMQGSPHASAMDGTFSNNTPLLDPNMDYAEWDADFENDGNWDYEFGADAMHNTPGSNSNSQDGDSPVGDSPQQVGKPENEKRKDPPQGDGSVDPHDTDPKRRDDKDNKTAKKPGRKPLTSEPTSKRKAQNRAAQRAFRERKEKHLKDLEQKVDDLEKASHSASHENNVLRAQIDRLQTELREYKRRLHTSEISKSSGLTGLGGFQFDFPPFGSGIFGSKDGKSNFGTDRAANNSNDNTRTPSLTNSVNGNSGTGSNFVSNDSSSSMHSTPKLNGGLDNTSSPSASSVSQHGPGSSCGTSPEPCGNSPVQPKASDSLKPISEEVGGSYVCKSGNLGGETESTFCEKLGMACGNPHNPIPKAPQFSTVSDQTANSLDWLAQQSSTTFDPVLFGDYRDPVNDINTNLNMSFFEDAFPVLNFDTLGSPLSPPAEKPVAPGSKKDLIATIDAMNNDDDDEVVPGDDHKQMLSCNKIWDRISSDPRFVSGELDMDGLCSELRSKAKCSEVGVVVAENDVQEVLGKVGMSRKDVM